MPKVAVVQEPPVFLDREATIAKAIYLIERASLDGADLIVFTEAFIPGYPAWVWKLRPGDDWTLNEEIYAALLKNAVDVGAGDLAPLQQAAKKHSVTVVCGVDERADDVGRTTIYNTVVTITPDGKIANKHRKLMPTNPERMVWGFGDATGLKVVDSPCGRIGSLICWENFMPLARYAMYAQGIEIYIAPTYDSGEGWLGTMQHIAREARCWVVGSGNILNTGDIPDDFPGRADLYPAEDEWINKGDSVVVAPDGQIAAGPLSGERGILYCDVDLAKVGEARRTLDVTGHYSRPDVFTLHVNTKAMSPVEFNK